MILKRLGPSDLQISSIGLGTWAMGGDNVFGWGPQDDAESIAAIHQAVERGINWIDTAPAYGFGHSEQIVGQALKEVDAARRPFLFMKCGIVRDEDRNVTHSLKADSVRNEVEASLLRLQVDVLDLCQIHWPSFPPGSPDPDIEEGWSALADLVAQGKIRHIGVSNFNVVQLKRAQAIATSPTDRPWRSPMPRSDSTSSRLRDR